jgi:hypothetical protein
MTPSPVVAPDRIGGRAVETNVSHKIGDNARVRVDEAARNAAGFVDGKTRSHGNSPCASRFGVQCDANMKLAPHGDLLYDVICNSLKAAGKGTRSRDERAQGPEKNQDQGPVTSTDCAGFIA